MNEMTPAETAGAARSIEFTGSMREFLPIAITNFLLTIATLFIYRSWAVARERRYLWSRTRFIDDDLHWSGTGKEMFVGFLVVALTLGVLGLGFAFGLPAVAARVGPGWAVLLIIPAYFVGLFLLGLAKFRALRYRLSRTWWHGIRGGSDDPGLAYGGKAIGYYVAAFMVAGLLFPWAQAKLWNERWKHMSFGPHRFTAEVNSGDTMRPFMLFWGSVVVGNIVLGLFEDPNVIVTGPGAPRLIVPLLIYSLMGVLYCGYLAAYYRSAAEWTRLGPVQFQLDAETSDWFGFYARTIGLAVVTLGLSMIVYNYRKWRFIVDRLEVFGIVDLDELTQSTTAAPKEAEGFLDALDIGAF